MYAIARWYQTSQSTTIVWSLARQLNPDFFIGTAPAVIKMQVAWMQVLIWWHKIIMIWLSLQ